jgi:hypothetical protein
MEGWQKQMKKIRIESREKFAWPMLTPAGITDRHIRATLENFEDSGLNLVLDIEIRDQKEKNGNRIVVERLILESIKKDSLGVTSELLRKVAIQKLAELCVLESIEQLYPKTKKKKSLKVPTQSDLSRMEQVAQASLSLGVKPPVKLIRSALLEQGIDLTEGTIRNYLTKASKAGLLKIKKLEETEIPAPLKDINPDKMSAESDLISKLINESISENLPPISPIQYRKKLEKAQADAIAKKEKQLEFIRAKRKKDLERRDAPLKPKHRKEGK